MKPRFVGPGPFIFEDRDVFFGRDVEIDYLTTLILNNKTTVIHGRSGLGKSSLINAGIIPNLLKKYHCEIIRVRFFNQEKDGPKPVETFLNILKDRIKNKEKYLTPILDNSKHNAWQALKTLQWNSYRNERLNQLDHPVDLASKKAIPVFKPFLLPEKNYLLVFDQFEELFTYDVSQVKKFMKELQEVLCNIIPEEIPAFLRKNADNEEKIIEHREELEILDKEIPVRLIFSIRSDQFNYMTHLVPFIPDLLKNTYKILRLSPSQLEEAINRPPKLTGEFLTPEFEFDPPLVKDMIGFLLGESSVETKRKIEAFEMQIICQQLEELLELLIKKNGRNFFPEKIVFKYTHMFMEGGVTDQDHPFAEILKNYYKEIIKKIADPAELLSARYLIERKLINFRTNKRISLDSALVAEMGLKKETEKFLAEKSILRIESNSVSGSSYEISHDNLVPAISRAALELGDLDKKLHDHFHAAFHLKKKLSRKLLLNFVYDDVINGMTKPLPERIANDDSIKHRLDHSGVFLIILPAKNNAQPDFPTYSIREAFRIPAQQGKEQYQNFYKNKLTSKLFLSVAIGLLTIVGLLIAGNQLIRKVNRNFALYYLAYVADTLQNKEVAVRLAEYINDENVVYPADSSLFNKKVLLLFQDQRVQSKEAIHTDTLPVTTLKSEKTAISTDGKFKIVLLSNSDSINVQNNVNCTVTRLGGGLVREFSKINNAYFLNRDGLLLCSFSSGGAHEGQLFSRPFEMSNGLMIYDCNRDSIVFSYRFKKNEILYPYQFVTPPVLENAEYSYRAKVIDEEYIIPFMRIDSSGRFVSTIRIFHSEKPEKDLPFYLFNNTSADGKKLLVGKPAGGQTAINIYNATGDSIGVLKQAGFVNYAQNNAVLYDSGTVLIYKKNGVKLGQSETSDVIDFAWMDTAEHFILIKNKAAIQIVDIATWQTRKIPERLIGFNFSRKIMLTQVDKNKVRVHYADSDKTIDGSYPDSIQAIKYNHVTSQALLLTGKHKLLLLSPELQVLAGYQLTPNDIFGFSPDGNSFYYVRDQYYSVFLTTGKLVNYFKPEAAFGWLQQTNKIKPIDSEKIRTQYGLSFTRQIF